MTKGTVLLESNLPTQQEPFLFLISDYHIYDYHISDYHVYDYHIFDKILVGLKNYVYLCSRTLFKSL